MSPKRLLKTQFFVIVALYGGFSCVPVSAIVLDLTNTFAIQDVVIESQTFTSSTSRENRDDSRAQLNRINLVGGDFIDTATFNNTLSSVEGSYIDGTSNFSAGLGVFTGVGGGSRTAFNPATDGAATEAAFLADVLAATESLNLRNYLDFNSVNNGEVVQLTYNYSSIVDPTGTILVGERDGNSAFTLQALNGLGNQTGVDIEIGSNSPALAFDTGFSASAETQDTAQSIEIAVFDISLFSATEDIESFRLINGSGADVFLVVSSARVPEPSSFGLIFGTLVLGFTGSRRRRRLSRA